MASGEWRMVNGEWRVANGFSGGQRSRAAEKLRHLTIASRTQHSSPNIALRTQRFTLGSPFGSLSGSGRKGVDKGSVGACPRRQLSF